MVFRSSVACVLFMLAAVSSPSNAEEYPSRPIRVVVPLSAGSLTDTAMRSIAAQMGAKLKAPLVVENMPGAALVIGTTTVAKAQPDGYTLLVAAASSFSVNPHVSKKLPYDPVKDFTPVCRVGGGPFVLAVNPSLGVKTLPEFLAKAKSTNLSFASAGTGTISHLAQEMFKAKVKTPFLHVPYKGTTQAVTDVVGGFSQAILETPGPLLAQIQSGKLTPLGITGAHRSPSLPNVPTFDELGYAGLHLIGWIGLAAPAGTPAAVVNRLATACQSVVASPDFQKLSRDRGLDIDYAGPAEFGSYIAKELPKWGDLVKLAGITPE